MTAHELNRGAKLEPSVDLKEIKAIIDLMKKNSLTEFELELNDFKIKLRRPLGNTSSNVGVTPIDDPELTAYVPLARAAHPAVSHSGGSNDSEIKSPMIGTFYRSPSPEAAPYVDVGSEVAMKVMNEVKAEVRGVITSIPAENAKPVEFGQPLFKIRPL